MKRQNGMNIADALQFFAQEMQITGKIEDTQIIDFWRTMAGNSLSAKVKSVYIKDKKMVVTMSSSTAKNELSFMRQEMLEKINETYGESTIEEIILK